MKKNQVFVVFLAIMMTLCISGCEKEVSVGDSNLAIWYEASSVKIIQDDHGEAAKTALDKQVLKVNMARNESEGVQLMLHPKKNIKNFDIAVSDLTCGTATISSDVIDVYQVKYMLKEESLYTDGNPAFPTGSYIPDALLPFETAVEYEENVIEANKNQAIYFDITTTKDTAPGLYEGVVTVTVDQKEYKMPLNVTVYDVVYPDTAKLKTAFSMFDTDTFATAELDGSTEQYIKYYETLLDYNMACALPFEGEGGIERYLELLRTYINYPGFSSYRLYYAPGNSYKGETGYFNGDLMHEYLAAIVQISIEDQIDYLDKAYFYGYNIVDEPTTEDGYKLAQSLHVYWEKILKGVDADMRQKYAGTEAWEYYEGVLSGSLLSIPNVMPASYTPEIAEKLSGYTYVPIINDFETEYERNIYHELATNELWTYTCVGPKYPYPSAHTDDYSLGFRLTSWMCFDYNLDGFLMWASTQNVLGPDGEVVVDPWSDIYDGFSRPGDGKYFYPGEKYGLESPCPTLTAMQYRDGVDDFSLLQSFEDVYNKYGLTADALLADSFEQLYNGVTPITDSYVFEAVREDLLKKAEALQNDTAVIYANKTIELGVATVELFTVDDAAKLYVDSQEIAKNEKGSYVFNIDLLESSELNFTVSNNGHKEEHTYRLIDGILGSVTDFDDVTSVENYISSNTIGFNVSLNQDAKFANNGSQSLHVVMNSEKEGVAPYFTISPDSQFLDGNWENLQLMQFMVYNAGNVDAEMMATYYTTQEIMIENITLPAGQWTVIELNRPEGVDLSKVLEYSFNFERETAVDLYLDDFTVVVEEE